MLPDGLDEFRVKANAREIGSLLAQTTRWVDPETFFYLPVWQPFTARKAPLFKANWVDRKTNKGQPKFEGNVAANVSLTAALGLKSVTRRNWTCCHLWGNDDDTFQSSESEVNDPRYFTCVANMVLVPSPMKTFTDTVPEVKAALRIVAHRLYGFLPETRTAPSLEEAGAYFPGEWQQGEPPGIHPFDVRIKKTADRAIQKLHHLIGSAPGNFPKQETLDVCRYWVNQLPNSALATIGLGEGSCDDA